MKLTLFILLFTNQVFAITLEGILSSYQLQEDVPELQNSISYINDLSVRVGQKHVQEEDSIDSDLDLRFSVSGWDEQKHKSKLKINQQNRLAANRKEALNKELALVYKLYLKLYFGKREKKKLNELLVIYKDKISVLKVYIKKNKDHITELINVERKIHEIENKLLLKDSELEKSLNLLNGLVNKKITLAQIPSSERFLSVDGLVNIVEKSASEQSSPKLDLEKAKLEYELEKGENSKLVDFIQLGVARKNIVADRELQDTVVGVTLGLSLPFLRDKTKVNEKFIQKLQAEYEAKYERKAFVEEVDELKLTITRVAKSLKQLLNASYVASAKKYLKTYKRSKGIDPLKLLELNNTIVQGEIEEIQLRSEMYNTFIAFLKVNGQLSIKNKENVLGTNFKGEA